MMILDFHMMNGETGIMITDNLNIIQRKSHYNTSGIYLIHNYVTDKIYIGSATDLIKRRDSHLSYLRNNKHYNQHLQRSWNKYGEINFTFYCLKLVDKLLLRNIEQHYMNKILFADCDDERFYKLGYNTARNSEHPGLGRIMSKEQKAKLSKNRLGSKNPMYGRVMSEETKNKMSRNSSRYWSGKTHSVESRKKISNNHVDTKGSNNPFAKLNEIQVIEIRNRYINENISMRKLGNEYGVSSTNIKDILKRKIWRHI